MELKPGDVILFGKMLLLITGPSTREKDIEFHINLLQPMEGPNRLEIYPYKQEWCPEQLETLRTHGVLQFNLTELINKVYDRS